MAQLIAEMATQRAGEVLCGELIRRGLDPVKLSVVPGGDEAVIVLSIVDHWCKAVKLPGGQLVPEAVEMALETWRAKVRADLRQGKPTEVIRQAIQQFGADRVEQALKPQSTVQ